MFMFNKRKKNFVPVAEEPEETPAYEENSGVHLTDPTPASNEPLPSCLSPDVPKEPPLEEEEFIEFHAGSPLFKEIQLSRDSEQSDHIHDPADLQVFMEENLADEDELSSIFPVSPRDPNNAPLGTKESQKERKSSINDKIESKLGRHRVSPRGERGRHRVSPRGESGNHRTSPRGERSGMPTDLDDKDGMGVIRELNSEFEAYHTDEDGNNSLYDSKNTSTSSGTSGLSSDSSSTVASVQQQPRQTSTLYPPSPEADLPFMPHFFFNPLRFLSSTNDASNAGAAVSQALSPVNRPRLLDIDNGSVGKYLDTPSTAPTESSSPGSPPNKMSPYFFGSRSVLVGSFFGDMSMDSEEEEAGIMWPPPQHDISRRTWPDTYRATSSRTQARIYFANACLIASLCVVIVMLAIAVRFLQHQSLPDRNSVESAISSNTTITNHEKKSLPSPLLSSKPTPSIVSVAPSSLPSTVLPTAMPSLRPSHHPRPKGKTGPMETSLAPTHPASLSTRVSTRTSKANCLDQRGTFPFYGETRNCHWLSRQSQNVRNLLCSQEEPAYSLCRETCHSCP